MTDLNNNDYKHILEYYKKPIPKSSRLLKLHANKILSEKLLLFEMSMKRMRMMRNIMMRM